MPKILELSVHDIVDEILRKGDLDNRFFNKITMEEGSRLHRVYQESQGENYLAEYALSHSFTVNGYQLNLKGRADGLIKVGDEVIIDEIKTTNNDIDKFYEEQGEWHLGQAKFYAYMYLLDTKEDNIKVQLTYISQLDNKEMKQYIFSYSFEELESYCRDLLVQFVSYISYIDESRLKRQESLQNLVFPFSNLREGQKEMMDFVSASIENEEIGFIEAKTGIGKTIATLYPSLKSLCKNDLEKIFYLTSKNSIKKIAYKNLNKLNETGGCIRALILSSKDDMCINEEKKKCNPDECKFAKNYYDRIHEMILKFLKRGLVFSSEDVKNFAIENEICPFEFQLDLSMYMDVIVGDYNYVFDPRAKLIRYFEDAKKKPYVLLIDEGHNLPSRVRDMYSVSIDKYDLFKLLKDIKECDHPSHFKKLKTLASEIIDIFTFETFEESCSRWENIKETIGIPDSLLDYAAMYCGEVDRLQKKYKKVDDFVMDLYYAFKNLEDLPYENDERFAYYFTFDDNRSAYKYSVSLLDSRKIIKDTYKQFKGGVVFSATLTPKDYFIDLLGGNEDSGTLYLKSPFDRNNLLVISNPYISTVYRDRDNSVSSILSNILSIVSAKKGNYFIFFPSFEYLNKFRNIFDTLINYDCYYQTSSMSEEERDEFLSHFKKEPDRTTLGFLVLGGIFSEGIDLVEDRLIGAIIVSIGLPKMNYLSDKIMDYFKEDEDEKGYHYAYTYPGLNRVFQAAGRVIRAPSDKGVICFIDKRYNYSIYRENLKDMYGTYLVSGNNEVIKNKVKEFWSE